MRRGAQRRPSRRRRRQWTYETTKKYRLILRKRKTWGDPEIRLEKTPSGNISGLREKEARNVERRAAKTQLYLG